MNPILFSPLPYPHAGRIIMIWNAYQGARSEIAFGTYRELLERSRSFEAMAVFEPCQPALAGGVRPVRLAGQSVSPSFFHVLGVAPWLGRDFRASEAAFDGPKVVILSGRLWKQRFDSDRAIVGHQVKLNDDNYTVIGVMPPNFENVLSPSAEIWTCEQYDTRKIAASFNTWEWGNHLHLAGRLKPGINKIQAQCELDQITRNPRAEFPRPRWAALHHGLTIDSLQDDIAHNVEPALLAVLGAVVLVLAIARVNVINLVLARNAQRCGEFTLRAALAVIGLLTGFFPALHVSREELHLGLQQSSRRTAGSHSLTRQALVVTELAFALILLVGAGLLLRSMQRVLAVKSRFLRAAVTHHAGADLRSSV